MGRRRHRTPAAPESWAAAFGGLIPAALAVDTAGNRVLEPGETVDVRPTWRNINGAAQTFSGTLTNITGPAGAVYTITDPVGDYGTVPNDTNAPCADCYAVAVSDPVSASGGALGRLRRREHPSRHSGPAEAVAAARGRQLHRRAAASPFYRFIETLLHHGVTGGCSATAVLPGQLDARASRWPCSSSWRRKAPDTLPPACATPMFADVPASSPFCRWIEELARRGGGGRVRRRQLLPVGAGQPRADGGLRAADAGSRARAAGVRARRSIADVPATSPFCRWIEELTRRSVVTGCGGGNYCPTAAVTREQMGVFISATFGLTLYGP